MPGSWDLKYQGRSPSSGYDGVSNTLSHVSHWLQRKPWTGYTKQLMEDWKVSNNRQTGERNQDSRKAMAVSWWFSLVFTFPYPQLTLRASWPHSRYRKKKLQEKLFFSGQGTRMGRAGEGNSVFIFNPTQACPEARSCPEEALSGH